MVHSHKQSALHGIREQALYVRPAALQFNVVAIAHPIDARVHLRSARHRAGYFLAQEEIGMSAQFFDGVDRIVIGYGDKVHAAPFQCFVERSRFVITFPANAGKHGHCAHA